MLLTEVPPDDCGLLVPYTEAVGWGELAVDKLFAQLCGAAGPGSRGLYSALLSELFAPHCDQKELLPNLQ